jgi:viroplasmin and RNaseH domain-containing protein
MTIQEEKEHNVNDLYLYSINDGELYIKYRKDICIKHSKQHKNGTYNKNIVIKDYERFLIFAVNKYNKEFNCHGSDANKFTKEIRYLAAQEIEQREHNEYELGNYTED